MHQRFQVGLYLGGGDFGLRKSGALRKNKSCYSAIGKSCTIEKYNA